MNRKTLCRLIVMLILTLLTLIGCGSSSSDTSSPASITPTVVQMDAITTPSADGLAQVVIGGVTIINGVPVVTFAASDENGQPLDPNVLVNSGDFRFTISRIGTDGNYQCYVGNKAGQASFDSSGIFAKLKPGVWTYSFTTNIQDSTKTLKNIVFDPTLTHTVGAEVDYPSTKNGQAFTQSANPLFHFRPDGKALTAVREVVSTSACNGCHGKFSGHGSRHEIALCILCHNPGVINNATGNSVDMKVLIHKIHMGKNLPSFKIGGANSAQIHNGSFNDYSTIVYPLLSGDSLITNTPINCTQCHQKGTDLLGKPYGANVDNWKTNPTQSGCVSCHDMTTFDGTTTLKLPNPQNLTPPQTVPNYKTVTNAIPHTPGNIYDIQCVSCHPPKGSDYDGFSVPGAHTILEKSSVYLSPTGKDGINFQILSVKFAKAGSAAGQTPIVTIKVTDGNGTPMTPFGNLVFAYANLVNGAFSDYLNVGTTMGKYGQPISQSTSSPAPTNNGDGSYTVTFPTAPTDKSIPATATGIGVIGWDSSKQIYNIPATSKHHYLPGAKNQGLEVGGKSVQFFFDIATGQAVTDPTKKRRQVVDVAKCNVCHSMLRFHGGGHTDSIDQCAICHNSVATDKGSRLRATTAAADGLSERSIELKSFIHSLHMGENLTQKPYIIYHGANNYTFSEIRYPNDMKNCLACHISDDSLLPSGSAIGTTVLVDPATPLDTGNTIKMSATASTCTSCHDAFLKPFTGTNGVYVWANPNTSHGDLQFNGCSSCHINSILKVNHQPSF